MLLWLILCTSTCFRSLNCLKTALRSASRKVFLAFLIVRENLCAASLLSIVFFELIFPNPLVLLAVWLRILLLSSGSGIGDLVFFFSIFWLDRTYTLFPYATPFP